MNDQSFDKIIKDALQHYQKVDQARDWSHFAERVAREVDQEPVDAFDQILRDKLTHYEAPYQPAHWEQFAHQLDASLHDQYAEELDQHVHQTLKEYQVPYAPNTWSLLEEKMVAHRRYIRRLYLTKAMEVAALVLFLFTFYRFLPMYQDLVQSRSEQIPVASAPAQTETDLLDSAPQTKVSNEQMSAAKLPGTASGDQITAGVGNNLSSQSQVAVRTATTPTKLTPSNQVTTNNFNSAFEAEIHASQRPLALESHQVIDESEVAKFMQPIPPVLPEQEIATRDPLASFASFRSLPGTEMAMQSQENAIFLSGYEKERKQRVPKRISMFGTLDINHALLSSFKLTDKVAFAEKEVTNLGHGAGVSVLFDYGRVELETGVQYNNIQNDPNTQVKVGTPTIGIEDFDYYLIDWDVIKLPLNVLYKLKDAGRTQYYASFGVDLSIVANATYYYSAPPITAFRVPDPNDDAARNSRNIVNRDLQQMQTSLLDKGKKDAYFNFHIGAGMEYMLTDRHSLFVETAFQQPLVTPSVINEKDRFKTISSKLGARMAF